jgi:gluconolactonase
MRCLASTAATDGRLYVATSLAIQVCDQAGRVNFIIPTPQQPATSAAAAKN